MFKLRKIFSCSELCTRWDINKNELTGIVRDGGLKASNDTYSLMEVKDNRYFYRDNSMLGAGAVSEGPLPVTDENGFYFLFSNVAAFEKDNSITPHILPSDPTQKALTDNPPEPAKEKPLDKRSISKRRVSIVVEEARNLHRDYPKMNKVEAKKKIDAILEGNKYTPKCRPLSRTHFNRVTKYIGLPPAKRGRKSTKNKK